MTIRFGSLFSGIEAASVAWHPLGWQTSFVAEVDPFATAVLSHRLPDVPNLGDVTSADFTARAKACGPIDVLVGGSPCQAFSLAGQRRSLSDERGNLTLRYVELVDDLDPDVVLWENVPGVLNTPDNAFGHFLSGIAGESSGPLVCPGSRWPDAGHIFGPRRNVVWRVLDTAGFGLAQRRRRVFVAACARGRDPGEILVECGGEVRNPAPVPAAQASLVAAAGIRAFGLAGHADYREGYLPTLRASGGDCGGGSEVLVVHPKIVGTICASGAGVSRAAGQGNELDFVIVQQRDGIEYVVRRLMPVECERLQGFPINGRRSPIAADRPRPMGLGTRRSETRCRRRSSSGSGAGSNGCSSARVGWQPDQM